MSKDKRKGWFAELVAGDSVIARHTHHGLTEATVVRVTPTGQFVIKTRRHFAELRFNHGGVAVNGSSYATWRLEPMTDQHQDTLRRQKVIRKLAAMSKGDFNNFETETLEQVAALLWPTETP